MKLSDKLRSLFDRRLDKDEREFLPAALEIVETPASPVGRTIGATIIVLFSIALIWACVGKVDIVAVAPGKVVPTGRTKTIQPFETGVVKAIYVHDGQRVKEGDVLIELDPTMNMAEVEHIRADLISAQLDVARLNAALTYTESPLDVFSPPAGAAPSLVAMQKQFLRRQVDEQRAKLAALDRQRAQKEAERETNKASIAKLENIIPVVQQRVDIRKALLDQAYASRVQFLEMQQMLVEHQQDLLVQQSHLHEAEAAVAAIIQTRVQTAAEYQRTLYGELSEAERKVAGLSNDLTKAERRASLQALSASVDGIVQQLAVHTIGGVVTPAQTLLVLVPVDTHLEIEASVSNRDIGFVRAGQQAEIKVDTFSFTRYGLLHGSVLSVSQDAVVRDTSKASDNNKSPGTESGSSEPKGQELLYTARVSLEASQMQIEDKLVSLSPGMAVTVEIKTGSRSLISYLLSPIIKYQQESLRER